MDDITSDQCIILPSPDVPRTQPCYLGLENMKALNLKLGQPVWVVNQTTEYLCCAWPRQDGSNTYVQYDKLVGRSLQKLNIEDKTDTKPGNKRFKCTENGKSATLLLKPVIDSVVDITLITVDVAVTNYVDVPQTRKASVESLSQYFKQILQNSVIGNECLIDVESHISGKLSGISFLKVSSAQPKFGVGRIGSRTEVQVSNVCSKDRLAQRYTRMEHVLGGLEMPAQILGELVILPTKFSTEFRQLGIAAPKGVLLRGPPGCGKTSLVQSVCSDCGAYLIVINGAEVFGSRPGESEDNLRNLFHKAHTLSQEGPCILLIDEIDALCPKAGKNGRGQEHRIVAQLCSLMDGVAADGCLMVVGATNRPNAIDISLRRPGRFDKEIFIGIPTQAQRRSILDVVTRNIPLQFCVDLDSLSQATNGYSGTDLVSLCREASYLSFSNAVKDNNANSRVTMEDFKAGLTKFVPSSQRGVDGLVDSSPVTWEDIGGYEDVKIKIQQAVEWPMKHPEAFARLGLSRPRGVLLYGPPGCSKTMLVRAAATSCNVTFLSLSGAQLFSPFVGDSEKAVTEVFQRARAGAPSIIFFDEIDAIIGKRSEGNHSKGVQERVLSTLLNEMDGVGIRMDDKQGGNAKQMILEGESTREPSGEATEKVNNSDVLLVAATNRPDMLDDALMRPGRIDRIVYVPPPDQETRLKILKVHSRNTPIDGVNMNHLAKQTEGYTGADLEGLCREAALIALTQDGLDASLVRQKHFDEAIKASTSSVTKESVQQYKDFQRSK